MVRLKKMDLLTHFIAFGSLFDVTSGFLEILWGKNSTGTEYNKEVSTVPPSKDEGIDPVKAEAGTIAGAVFGVLIGTVLVAIVGFLYIKRKRERDREYTRQATVHRMAQESAGVYTDTTLDTNFLPSENDSGDYRSLRKNPNIYESDSEDEL